MQWYQYQMRNPTFDVKGDGVNVVHGGRDDADQRPRCQIGSGLRSIYHLLSSFHYRYGEHSSNQFKQAGSCCLSWVSCGHYFCQVRLHIGWSQWCIGCPNFSRADQFVPEDLDHHRMLIDSIQFQRTRLRISSWVKGIRIRLCTYLGSSHLTQ